MTPFVDWLGVSSCTQKEKKMSVFANVVEKQIILESSHVNVTDSHRSKAVHLISYDPNFKSSGLQR